MTNPELPAFISELEALQAKSTPGPWTAVFHDGYADCTVENSESNTIATSGLNYQEDGEFIAAARNHIPALLLLVRELKAENQGLRAKVDELEEGIAELGERAYL